jgi:hypothetical protein
LQSEEIKFLRLQLSEVDQLTTSDERLHALGARATVLEATLVCRRGERTQRWMRHRSRK